MVLRQQQLRAGAAFWSFVCFQGLANPTISDFAPLNSLPESARGTALAHADCPHDGRLENAGHLQTDFQFHGQVGESRPKDQTAVQHDD